MSYRNALSMARKVTVAGLLVAAAGISTLFLTNSVAVPPIPIGPILLVLAALLMAFGPWRWTPAIGVGLALAILVGGIISGIVDHLSNAAQIGGFIGSWLNVLGLITAIVAGTLAIVQNYQTRGPVTSR